MPRVDLRGWVAVLAASAVSLSGCSGGDDSARQGDRPAGERVTIRVPADAPTISAAVSLAQPGDLVLVAPGVYHDRVKITTPDITLRGESRNDVILDGRLRQSNGVVVAASGVAVENLTVKGNTQNGVLVTGSAKAIDGAPGEGGYDTGDEEVHFVESFLVSHVTATGNGLYGIYAFSARNGVIEGSYASGSADSGIYLGQCKPCRVVVRDNVAELNAIGFEGTNASGDVYVVGNRFSGNRVGLTISSDHQEKLLPQQGSVIAGNLIAANQQAATPEQADGGWGTGVGIDGGSDNRVIRNRITDNAGAGLVITATQNLPANGNQVVDNVFTANGVDVAWTFPTATKGYGNCVGGADLRTVPAGLAAVAPCPATAGSPSPSGVLTGPRPPRGIPFTDVAAPPAQPRLPNTTGATAVPAVPALPDLAGVLAPTASLLADRALVRVS
ncbi:right-handed parallel beta-helix repeat-containing protein [Actinokineospora sp. PR83]|uniref:right-handed parallel beta-helix repeat-containing protein n=1 Tax=Actinokineospora sp. PR83 TaxID=2884908 RepID=UPI001F35066A|nr:right-handed parallel beta-helix repeat-containing protein [Actinokineospora sp. PR83]MCG8914357.1 right-handed parallel beta-helix repeat-containing protein [Actinokineospora sp. PR83]